MVVCIIDWQASVPFEALKSAWTDGYRTSWGMKLYSSTTAEELLQVCVLGFYVLIIYLNCRTFLINITVAIHGTRFIFFEMDNELVIGI